VFELHINLTAQAHRLASTTLARRSRWRTDRKQLETKNRFFAWKQLLLISSRQNRL